MVTSLKSIKYLGYIQWVSARLRVTAVSPAGDTQNGPFWAAAVGLPRSGGASGCASRRPSAPRSAPLLSATAAAGGGSERAEAVGLPRSGGAIGRAPRPGAPTAAAEILTGAAASGGSERAEPGLRRRGKGERGHGLRSQSAAIDQSQSAGQRTRHPPHIGSYAAAMLASCDRRSDVPINNPINGARARCSQVRRAHRQPVAVGTGGAGSEGARGGIAGLVAAVGAERGIAGLVAAVGAERGIAGLVEAGGVERGGAVARRRGAAGAALIAAAGTERGITGLVAAVGTERRIAGLVAAVGAERGIAGLVAAVGTERSIAGLVAAVGAERGIAGLVEAGGVERGGAVARRGAAGAALIAAAGAERGIARPIPARRRRGDRVLPAAAGRPGGGAPVLLARAARCPWRWAFGPGREFCHPNRNRKGRDAGAGSSTKRKRSGAECLTR
jgi:hypothetical protein